MDAPNRFALLVERWWQRICNLLGLVARFSVQKIGENPNSINFPFWWLDMAGMNHQSIGLLFDIVLNLLSYHVGSLGDCLIDSMVGWFPVASKSPWGPSWEATIPCCHSMPMTRAYLRPCHHGPHIIPHPSCVEDEWSEPTNYHWVSYNNINMFYNL